MTHTKLFAAALLLGLGGAAQADSGGEAQYLAENRAAMDKMMRNMDVAPTGNVDRDFTETMIPHHHGAIDMAQAELRYGHNPQLRRMAREIVANQQRELVTMRRALNPPPAAAAPERPGTGTPSQ